MRRPVAGVWDVPSGGVLPALAVAAAFFFLGGLAGCLLASQVGGGGSDSLTLYLKGFLSAAQAGGVSGPALLPLVWETARWPVLALLLGFTALGILGLPLLFGVRGFLLAFSIASFVRMFGGAGGLLAFLVFGVSGVLAVPAFFVLGVQGLVAARSLAGRFLGEGRRNSPYGRAYFLRCGVCAGVLCVCVLLEYLAVPALVAGAAGALLS